jgi:hypothetical protein
MPGRQVVGRPSADERRKEAAVTAARYALYFLHIVGVVAIIVGFGVQVAGGGRGMPKVALHGAATQLLTGVALVGVREADDLPVNMTKISVKLGITLVVLVLVAANRKRDPVPEGVFYGALGLVLVNVGLALGWN